MRRGRTAGWRGGWVEDSTIVWHSGSRPAGTGTAQGRGAAMTGCCSSRLAPSASPLRERSPRWGITASTPCLSFPHRSILHANARSWEGRAAPHGRGQHPTTSVRHPAALGLSPKAGCGELVCPHCPGLGTGLRTDRSGVQEVIGAIASPLGRRVCWLLETAELVVAHR